MKNPTLSGRGLKCNIFVSLLPINPSTPKLWLALLKDGCFCKEGWYKRLPERELKKSFDLVQQLQKDNSNNNPS
jgi:hypothetical protein